MKKKSINFELAQIQRSIWKKKKKSQSLDKFTSLFRKVIRFECYLIIATPDVVGRVQFFCIVWITEMEQFIETKNIKR